MPSMENFDQVPKGRDRKKLVEELGPEAFPILKHRKSALQSNAEKRKEFEVVGGRKIREERYYNWTDSKLESYNGSFNDSFDGILPYGERLGHYIERTLKDRKGEAVGVEFGGVGSNLFSGFSKNFFKKTMGITLVDHRDLETFRKFSKNDYKNNHQVMLGDVLNPETYKKLEDKLSKSKIDLIISRMAAGLEFIPTDPYELNKVLQTWYHMLNENGLMIVQVPKELNNILAIWVREVKKKFGGVIEAEFTLGTDNNSTSCSSFRLRKLKGAPAELPVLSPKVVRTISKY